MASYNGWPTYQTWLVFVWLTNDQDTYQLSCEMVGAADTVSQAADSLKLLVESGTEVLDHASLYADLLTSALSLVVWDNLAHSFLGAA